jgi:hypothetical protein
MMTAWAWLFGVALVLQVPPPQAAALESAALEAERRGFVGREGDELRALARRLEAAGRKEEAAAVSGWIEPAPPERGPSRFVPLAEVVPARAKPRPQGLANVAASGGPATPAEIDAILGRTVRELFELALRALGGKLKHYALADGCLRAVLARDPDHAEARRLLGYVAYDEGWATPFALDQLKSGKVLHPTYGWVDAAWLPHLEQGELPARGASVSNPREVRWLPAAEADLQRNAIERGWRIRTEHFEVLTDVPLSEAIAFGRKLESFNDLFFSILADVIAEDLPLARRFREKPRSTPAPPPRVALHTVYYFARQDEFVEYLKQRGEQGVEKILGLYYPPRKGERRAPAYFFRDEGGQIADTATLFHEVSHQLLFESTSVGTSAYKNNVGNYWVFEGLGTYFETVTSEPDGSLQVGGFVGPRIKVAQVRLIDRHEYQPIEQFVRLGPSAFNDPERVYLHYAQAMALAVFLMDGRGGKYREGFLDYVRDAHRGRLRGDGGHLLDDRLGVAYKALDAEFLAALQPGP